MVSVKSVQKIETTDITNLSVITAKLADAAVTTAKIGDSQVAQAKLDAAAVDTINLVNAAVVAAKIANGAVGTAKIADNAVTTAKIAADEVGPADVSPDLIQTGSDTIGTAETTITFPASFPGVPTVVAVGKDVVDVKVTGITSSSFTWAAEASGTAYWAAFYYT